MVAAGDTAGDVEFDATHDMNLARLPLSLEHWGVKSFAGLKGYWKAISQIKKLKRSEAADVVHCGRVLPEGVMALGLKYLTGTPFLCYVHGEDVTTAVESREYVFLIRRVLKNTKVVIANSQNTADILTNQWNVPVDKVRVLHPGVDTKRFTPVPACQETRQRLGWEDRKVVLTVGRLQRRKGQDQLIRAISKIRESVPNVLYSIIGGGNDREYLEQIVAEEGVSEYVQFRGEPDDSELASCYQQCDLFVLPNRQEGNDIEGFGMVLLEAQACGKPVIAGASGGTRETMKLSETGVVIPCDTPSPLDETVANLLLDDAKREQMGLAAREWVVEQFDWDSLAVKATELFDSVDA